jgi:hypothetical protein
MEAIGHQILHFDVGLAFFFLRQAFMAEGSGVLDVRQTLTTSRINRQGACGLS